MPSNLVLHLSASCVQTVLTRAFKGKPFSSSSSSTTLFTNQQWTHLCSITELKPLLGRQKVTQNSSCFPYYIHQGVSHCQRWNLSSNHEKKLLPTPQWPCKPEMWGMSCAYKILLDSVDKILMWREAAVKQKDSSRSWDSESPFLWMVLIFSSLSALIQRGKHPQGSSNLFLTRSRTCGCIPSLAFFKVRTFGS